jgi:hypothetical protein
VVSRHGEDGSFEAAEQRRRPLVLVRPSAVRQVARGDHDRGFDPRDEVAESPSRGAVIPGADVEIRDVNEPDWHDRSTLYTQIEMTEPTELFDDLYLGLRAGGAIRKRRRGESLTSEEEAALTRWQRLSQWRKTIAIGAFAVGTFGLGFTLGGIVFSRRGKREAV